MSSSPATMFATRSIQRSRQTRRSACDRCRTYKLRCERSLAGGSECERCARTSGATCTTTTTKPLPGSRLLIAKSPVPCLRPPHAAILPPPTPVGQRASAQEQEQQRQRQGSGMLDLGMPSPMSMIRTSSMDFSLSSLGFPEDSHAILSHPSPSAVANDFVSFGDPAGVMLTPPSPSPAACSPGSFADMLNMPEPNLMQALLDLCTSLVDDHDALKAFHTNHLSINDFPGLAPDMPLQSLLDNTAHFSSMLKTVSINEAAPVATPITNDQPRRPSQVADSTGYAHIRPKPTTPLPTENTIIPHNHQNIHPEHPDLMNVHKPNNPKSRDIVLTTTLITTYIILTRSWHQVFLNLYDILTLPSLKHTTISHILSLPILQLGGLHVLQNNPQLQIAVLLEISASMIQNIESYLGVGSDGGQQPSLNMDPVSVSIREALLSQEMLRIYACNSNNGRSRGLNTSNGEEGQSHLEGLSWREVMNEVKKRLQSGVGAN